ncbi:MAG: isocitrate/isopropylmalate dehydrogenase family protein [Candidatus Bathyarchaeia archaeon]
MYKVAVIPGDGIGPEQMEAALRVLKAVEEKLGVGLEFLRVEAGDRALKETGFALPEETLRCVREADASLKGPVGETAADVIVRLRQLLDLYANVRLVKAYPSVPSMRPDIDFVIVRENTEDLYKGMEFMADPETAVCLRLITRKGSERIAKYAFEMAQRRGAKRKVTIVHKGNVLRLTDGLFVKVCREVAKAHPDVTCEELLVDTAALDLIRRPQAFDVIVTTNMFGDILSDEAAQLVGGLGMAPSGNIGAERALFEPVHGCAPDIAGRQVANPCSLILSSAMMLQWLGERRKDEKCLIAGKAIERGVAEALSKGFLTRDLGGNLKTPDMGAAIAKEVLRLLNSR